jgi:hypothetical protein
LVPVHAGGLIDIPTVFLRLKLDLSNGAALALLAAGLAGFVVVQQFGTFGYLVRLFGKVGTSRTRAGIIDNATDLDAAIRAIYGRRARVVWSCLLWLVSRVVMSAEVWLAAALMGQAISLWEAIMLRSLVTAVRGIAIVVPAGWGLQEGTFILVGGLLGHSPDFMLALSLATRARQHLEGRSLWQRFDAMRRRSR